MATQSSKSHRSRKIAAVAAGLLVVGVGTTYTLASWNDSEWVWGGAADGGGPGVATSAFNIEQDTSKTFANNDWTDEPENEGGALTFTVDPTALAPGDSIYAPVALRADADSVGAEVTLSAAAEANATLTPPPTDAKGDPLWDAMNVKVYTQATTQDPFTLTDTCDSAGIEDVSGNWDEVTGISSLDSEATASQTLAANAGSVQHYCFVLSLDANAETEFVSNNPGLTLQGRSIAPAWNFEATSISSN